MRAFAVSLLLLCAAAGCKAWTLSDINGDLFSEYGAMTDAVARMPEPRADDDAGLSCQGECADCIRNGTRYVIHAAVERLREKCDNATSDFAQRICRKAREHPKVTLGVLIYKLRPIRLAVAYCAGRGDCHGNDTSREGQVMARQNEFILEAVNAVASVLNGTDHAQPPYVASGRHSQALLNSPLAAAAVLTDDSEGEGADFAGETEGSGMGVDAGQEFDMVDMKDDTDRQRDEDDRQECSSCVRQKSSSVMRYVSDKIVDYCLKTTDERTRRACAAAYRAPEVAFGYTLARVSPWKYSYGYCVGNGRCSASSGMERRRSSTRADEDWGGAGLRGRGRTDTSLFA